MGFSGTLIGLRVCKEKGPFRIIRTIVFKALYWAPPAFGNCHITPILATTTFSGYQVAQGFLQSLYSSCYKILHDLRILPLCSLPDFAVLGVMQDLEYSA